LCQSWNEIAPLHQLGTEQLRLLVGYLKSTYADTTQTMLSLLSTGYITYELLWALFKLNSLIYTTCSGTHKPRCSVLSSDTVVITAVNRPYCTTSCKYRTTKKLQPCKAVLQLCVCSEKVQKPR
jgi:hypothetical protein